MKNPPQAFVIESNPLTIVSQQLITFHQIKFFFQMKLFHFNHFKTADGISIPGNSRQTYLDSYQRRNLLSTAVYHSVNFSTLFLHSFKLPGWFE
jgi:hypothetical protein